MKKSIAGLLILMLALVAIPLKAEKDVRKVDTFTAVSLGVAADVYIQQGSTQSLELRGDEEDLERIETEVVNGRLKIKTNKSWGWSWRSGRIEIFITVKDLDGLSVSGSGKIITEDRFSTDRMRLNVSGSGRIQANIDAKEVDIDISGSGSVTLRGKSENSTVDISGSGRLSALEHTGDLYDIHISGSGSAKINVEQAIYASISGSGSVRYTGNPDKVRSKVSGSGSVKSMN